MNFEKRQPFENIKTFEVNPDDIQDVSNYYQFEINQGFSEVPKETTFDKMVAFRQKQIKENQLKVAKINKGNQIIGTSVVVLESGTMGKKIKPNEAWAAGTVVDKNKREEGIGKKLLAEQDRIAREAGKSSIVTVIANDNFPSMNLRMKNGYKIEGIDARDNEINYFYRKNLSIKDSNDYSKMDDQVLVNPNDHETVEKLLAEGYLGVDFIRSEDPENGNQILFVKKEQ